MEKIGLIAGNGKFPLIFAREAKKAGYSVYAIAIKEEADHAIAELADDISWISVGQLSRLLEILKREHIKKVVMAGQIKHKLLFSDITMDKELIMLLLGLKDKKTDTILSAIARRLAQVGVELMDSTIFLKNFLPEKGTLTRQKASPAQKEDIEFGLNIAKSIAGMDIGQTVVVKNKVVLAVEAIEGTDEAIRRGSLLGKGDVVVVKVSKPKQDVRFDVPLVGKDTIEVLIKEKVAVLAIEAGKTLFLDKDYVIEQADKNKIVIVAV